MSARVVPTSAPVVVLPRRVAASRVERDSDRRPVLTPAGHAELVARIHDLRRRVMPELVQGMRGEQREQAEQEYDALLVELARLDDLVARALVMTGDPEPTGTISLGSRVEVELPGGQRRIVRLVDPREAALDDERISVTSPLGRAMLGAEVGQSVAVEAPSRRYLATIVALAVQQGAEDGALALA